MVAARLIGPPPGYIGYARGQGGVLSRIRDLPHAVLLFDEVEKADPGLGKFLLQVLDEGTTEDNDGNLLDFRRAFVIFTTNAGCVYDAGPATVGFRQEAPDDRPRLDEDALRQQLAARFGQEFVGRLTHLFAFRSLDGASVRVGIGRLLDRLASQARARGLALRWEPSLADHLLERWQPRLGVRHLTSILDHRIEEQLSVADAQGDLDGVTAIELRALPAASGAPVELVGLARYQKQGEVLVVELG
jgi:ATP-dependent Clp protease ATP-binding subunit ClpA